ncbi:MAG: 1-acyl-sn-glycerol-3-phosphate acyltransferase [Helicobacteraceae bacterium]|nr:1-acyl-sn-glycerol-3-phosphate acyltransferase [Helicobacteraceae bacterium]
MYFRSFLFAAGYFLIVFSITATGALLGIFIPYKARFFVPIGVFRCSSFWLRVTCGVKYRFEGLENIPKDRAVVVVANHQSAWETYALQTLIVPICTILKRELLWIPFFGWSLAFLRPIAIDRSSAVGASKRVLKVGAQKLRAGSSVLIFPEGTRVALGDRVEFKRSAAILAKQTGAAALPIAHNAGACWPARKFLKRSGTIALRIGKPIETEGKSADQIHQEYERWIRNQMEELSATSKTQV